jgi:hypothetical protein
MPPRDFGKVTSAQAREFFDAYVGGAPARLARFIGKVAGTGGPPQEQLDFSSDSLVPLWDWFLQHLRPDASAASSNELPLWYEPDAPGNARALPVAVLVNVGGITDYFGEALRRQVPELKWGIGKQRVRGYIHHNRPILQVWTIDVDPSLTVYNQARGAFFEHERIGGEETAGALRRAFDRWVRDVQPPPGGYPK